MESRAIANPTPSLSSSIRFLRTVWLTMLPFVVGYSVLPEILGTAQKPGNPAFFNAISAVAITCIVVCFLFRRRFIAAAATVLVKDPRDIAALKRWQIGHILHFALSLSVALYSLVLRYVGFLAIARFAVLYRWIRTHVVWDAATTEIAGCDTPRVGPLPQNISLALVDHQHPARSVAFL
jgi:hypothetical protein